ncbi:hypothetical protein [Novosphingobium album (ex Liu et al. 2023)]|uniref:CheW-like domain-containing protein n=1 Tax=Novosphingobium album (ex Liu et al. 2023) TaxID=3031130 RepID=A0ABT5WKK1_9SPHN|nr:hypothetical protein [Novosphingobium album (ex Liu et al. 2023)]MDE8650568.1 hypothetical protein [Novosphingobium album (ex Liu et al. 2023)]
MRILLTRVRIGQVLPSYAYRAFVPFTEISLERQALIAMHSDFGYGFGLLARLFDVIAPMAHLEAPPGLEKHRFGIELDLVASRVGAILLHAAFPEMAERTVPFRQLVPIAPPNAAHLGEAVDLTGRHDWLSGQIETLTAEALGFRIEGDR